MRRLGLGALLAVLIGASPGAVQLHTRQGAEKACLAGDAAACTRTGEMYERGRVTPTRNSEPDPKTAVPFYERACKAGQADACARLAAVLEKGGAVTEDLAATAALYGKSCDGGHFAGCGGLARMHEQGSGVAPDPARAKTLYERAVALEVAACDRGNAQDCLRLGFFYREGTYGLAKNPARALQLDERACTLGEPAGCSQAAYLLGQATPGLTLDTKRAQALIDRAQALIVSQCDAGVIDACHTLMTPAADYKACLAGDPDSCWRVGRTYVPDTPERPGDYTRAMHFFLKGCEISAEHCVPAGELYAEGRGVTADVKRAAELFGRACEGGDLGGCFELARLYESGTGVTRDPARALALYERMCAADSYGCTRLAGLLLAGQGVQKDAARGVTLSERGCREHRDWEACLQLGLALRDGNGIARDAVAARKQLHETCRFEASLGCRAACDLGDAESCVRVADAVDTGRGVPVNPAEANALYEQAVRLFDEDCVRGNKSSCDGLLALHHRVRPILLKDVALALRLFTRACDARAGEGCYNAARIYDRGEGVPVDRARAVALYFEGCESGQLDSCVRAAEIYRLGQGLPVNPGRAAFLTERANEIRRYRRR